MSASPEMITFRNFEPGVDSVYDIGRNADGSVIEEIGRAFGTPTDNLGDMVKAIAPHKTLQDNIAFAHERLSLPDVQAELGQSGKTPYEIAGEWCTRAALQAAVLRPLMGPAELPTKPFDVATITDGVYNWMNRMTDITLGLAKKPGVCWAMLVHAGREIRADETPEERFHGMQVEHYMGGTLMTRLVSSKAFNRYSQTGTEETSGEAVMRAAAKSLVGGDFDVAAGRLLVPAVAGNWQQKGTQMRQAMQNLAPEFDSDPANRQLWVASDKFPLGVTGEESKTTHQNPLSAIGNVLRGAKLLDELKD